MQKLFKASLLLVLVFAASAFTLSSETPQSNQIDKAGVKIIANMNLQQTGIGTVQATWFTNEAGPYTVSVFDLTNNVRVQQFMVTGPSATVTGLTAGVKYRISAAGNINLIYADITIL